MSILSLRNGRKVGDYLMPYIVAELNTSHFGDINIAKSMIDQDFFAQAMIVAKLLEDAVFVNAAGLKGFVECIASIYRSVVAKTPAYCRTQDQLAHAVEAVS